MKLPGDEAFQKGAIAAELCTKNEDYKKVTEERDECLARTVSFVSFTVNNYALYA